MSTNNNLFVKQQENFNNSSDITQIAENVTKLHLEDNKLHDFSQNYLKETVKELCNLFNEEMKAKNFSSIFGTLEQFLIKKGQNPNDIINFCLNDHVSSMVQIVLASCYRYGKWVEKDEHKAFIHYQKSAEMGNAYGIRTVGYCYQYGIGVEKDEHKAFIYYQKSAEMGDDVGTNNVGGCYEKGIGVEKNEHKAFIYYQKSAEMGVASGTFNVGRCYEKGIGVEKNEHKAFTHYQKSAEMGHPTGMSSVGDWYFYGIGVEKDQHKAFIYYQKSAEMGDANGTFNVGWCYRYGTGVEKDEHKAFIYYQKSADMGNANGAINVGNCYLKGIGVEKDENKAFIYYQKSAMLGVSNGTKNVGYCYEKGIGVEKDEHKAFIHYQKSAEMGNASGTNNVGSCYFYGIGVEKDEHKAFIYYQKSANMGFAEGTFNVGWCYYHGTGIEKDEYEAFIYYQKSAEMGHAVGTNNVGFCYDRGIGVEKDKNEAFIYYQKSADMGNVSGTINVGNCYLHGIGVEKDEHKAFIYYQKSADMGNAGGTYNVGYCYRHGIGVGKNEHQAFVYYKKSAEMGDTTGMSKVAECYRNGIGITRDLDKAKYWYQRVEDLTLATNHKSEIDDDLKKILMENKYQLSWISYDEFDDIREIGKGGFATVYRANWVNKSQSLNSTIVLKLFHDSNNKDFIRELKAYCDIGLKDPTFLKCFGISKDKASNNYILAMEYAKEGSLRNNLHIIAQMDWKDKLNLLQCIASDLLIIHSQDLIHRDLHSGNILLNSVKSAYIADLGLSITANIALKSKSDGIFGILPYIDPEVLKNQPYTKASDIYSFAMIMWEILYGKPVPFEQESQFLLQIFDGLRPNIDGDTAICYADLMRKCWNIKPEKRPTAKEVYDIFSEWQNSESILSELSESDKKLRNIKHEYIESHYTSSFILFKQQDNIDNLDRECIIAL